MRIGLLNNRGVLHIPMLILTTVVAITLLGLIGLLTHWAKLTRSQLYLDQCVAEAAHDLKTKLQVIELENSTIIATRIAMVAGQYDPRTAAVLRSAQTVALAHQLFLQTQWDLKRAKWVGMGCMGMRADPSALPEMKWQPRGLPDQLGVQALSWEEGAPKKLEIRFWNGKRGAAAMIKKGEIKNEKPGWHMWWIPIQKPLWANLY